MIIVKITGGLGNQMFQYAVGRNLAYINDTELKLDIKTYDVYKNRMFNLDNLSIKASIASEEEINRLRMKDDLLSKIFLKVCNVVNFQGNHTYVKEKQDYFDPSILEISGDAYLEGFWQTEKYFVGISDILRTEFTAKKPLKGVNKEISKSIRETNSISVHLRRGDYVSNPIINTKFGTCSIEYYQKAISKIIKITNDPHFFVFSDDMEWTKENLKLNHPVTYVEHNSSEHPYEDLRLMSLCKHNIIANSSFSWWGAWLNDNRQKVVIAPRKWFK